MAHPTTTMINAMPGTPAPEFAGTSVISDRGFTECSLSNLISNDRWLVLMFFPMGFGYIAPTELIAMENIRPDLEALNCSVLACSTDAALIHEKFMSLAPAEGGVNGIRFPLLEDVNGDISESYGVMREGSGYSFRAYFIIDPQGIIRSRVVCDLPIGLGIKDIVQKVEYLKAAVNQDEWDFSAFEKLQVKEEALASPPSDVPQVPESPTSLG